MAVSFVVAKNKYIVCAKAASKDKTLFKHKLISLALGGFRVPFLYTSRRVPSLVSLKNYENKIKSKTVSAICLFMLHSF